MAEDPVADFLSREQDQIADLGDDDFVTEQNNQQGHAEEWNGDGDANQEPDYSAEPATDAAGDADDDSYTAIRSADTARSEPEKIREWRLQFEASIAEKDAAEATAIDEWRESARHELDTWVKNHEEQLVKAKTTNREAQEEFVKERDDNLPGGEWERVARLCDFNPKVAKQTKDVSRMRSILFRLKTEPLVR